MLNRRIIATSTAIALVGAIVCGCGDRSSTTADTSAMPAAPVAPPEPPPPTLAAQHEIALTEAGARLADDGLYVTIPGSSFGGNSQNEFQPGNTDTLDRVAGLLKERAELRLVITGYTDDRGRKASNERLSLQRAEAVRDHLVQRNHLEAERVEVKGAGPADPVAGNDTEEGRARNRRVVLRIMTEDGKYQSRAALGVQPADAPPTSGPPAA